MSEHPRPLVYPLRNYWRIRRRPRTLTMTYPNLSGFRVFFNTSSTSASPPGFTRSGLVNTPIVRLPEGSTCGETTWCYTREPLLSASQSTAVCMKPCQYYDAQQTRIPVFLVTSRTMLPQHPPSRHPSIIILVLRTLADVSSVHIHVESYKIFRVLFGKD